MERRKKCLISLRSGLREDPGLQVRVLPVEEVKEPFWKSGAMSVKFEDHDSVVYLVYNGDTCEFNQRKNELFDGCFPNEPVVSPKFVAEKSTDVIMKCGIMTNICVHYQSRILDANSFEEMREKYYCMSTPSFNQSNNNMDSSGEQTLMPINNPEFKKPINSSELNFNKLSEAVIHLLEVKKHYVLFLATSLKETIVHQSKKMDKLCSNNVQSFETSPAGDNSTCSSNNVGSANVTDKGESEKSNVHHDSNPCVYCSMQNNIFKTLEEQQKSLSVSLRLCERMTNVFNDMRELMSPNHSIGKRLQKSLLAELRGELFLSLQIIKMQTLYISNLNKMQKIVLALSASKLSADSHLNGKESKSAQAAINDQTNTGLSEGSLKPEAKKSAKTDVINRRLSEESLKPAAEGHLVASDEKVFDTSSKGLSSESLENCSSKECNLSNNYLQHDIFYLWRNLDVSLKCSNTLISLELSLIQMLYDILDKEKSSVVEILENIIKNTEQIFSKENVVLKHQRDPYEKEVRLAKTSDKLTASFTWKSGTIILPDGEGTMCTVDGHVIYQGSWKEGKIHGYGKAFMICEKQTYWSTKGEYEGNWRSNARHGFGRMVFSNGSVYDGEWKMDEIQGRGVMRRFDDCILEGYWLAGNPNGCVTFTWPHGSTEYREYKHGDLVRVFDPRQDLSPSVKTLRCIENAREEKTYYKSSLRSLREEMSSLKENYEEKEKQAVAQERAEKMQVVDTLRQALEQSQKMQQKEAESVEELQSRLDCQICMNRPKDCLLLPCLHFNFCTTCIGQLKVTESSLKCPTCRQITHGEIHFAPEHARQFGICVDVSLCQQPPYHVLCGQGLPICPSPVSKPAYTAPSTVIILPTVESGTVPATIINSGVSPSPSVTNVRKVTVVTPTPTFTPTVITNTIVRKPLNVITIENNIRIEFGKKSNVTHQ